MELEKLIDCKKQFSEIEIPKMSATGKQLNLLLGIDLFIEDKIYTFSSIGEAVKIAENEEF
jgi:hypothetical protein